MVETFSKYQDAFKRINTLVDEARSSGAPLVVSFDVFDTLIQRRVAPDMVLEGVARWLDDEAARRGLTTTMSAIEAYHTAYRELGEKNAEAGLDFEVKTDDLHADWAKTLVGDGDNENLAEAIADKFDDIECATCYAAPHVAELLEGLRGRAGRVIYISDMYIGDRCVRKILEANGLLKFFDAGHVSGDYALLKRTGNLFTHVAGLEGIETSDILHIGDNPESDGTMAEKAGARAIVIADTGFLGRRAALDKAYGEARADARWSGYVAAMAAQGMAGEAGTIERAVTLRLIGPVFASFIHGVAERCRDRKVDTVYFCAREGYVLKVLYETIAPIVFRDRPVPRAEYLPISRLSALVAANGSYNMKALSAAAANGRPTVANLFSILRLPKEKLSEIAARHGIGDIETPLPPYFRDWAPFQRLAADPEITETIAENHAASKAQLRIYLERLGFFDNDRVAFVDVGWSARIQEFLHDAMSKSPDCPSIFGMYMGMNLPAHWRKMPGNWMESIIADDTVLDWYAQACMLFPQLFEAVVRSPHGTVLGYKEDETGTISPVLKPEDDESRNFEAGDDPLLAHVQTALFDYARHYATVGGALSMTADDTRYYALEAMNRLVRFPRKKEAAIFLGLRNVSDLGSAEMLSLGNMKQGNWIWHPKMTRREVGKSFWKYGTLSRFGGFIPQAWYMMKEEVKRVPHAGHPLDDGIVHRTLSDDETAPKTTRAAAIPNTAERQQLSELERMTGERIDELSRKYRSPFDFVDMEFETRPLTFAEVNWARRVLVRTSKRLKEQGRHQPKTKTLPIGAWKKVSS